MNTLKETTNQTSPKQPQTFSKPSATKMFNLTKITYQKTRANIILNSETLEVFLLKLGQKMDVHYYYIIQYYISFSM